MKKLITFGCSFTYGHGLPDCLHKNGHGPLDYPSKMGWPSMLGNHLNLTVINKSVPGASNLEILYHLLNFNFSNDDTVVIMWTFPFRDLFFERTFKNWLNNKTYTQLKIFLQKSRWRKLWIPDGDERDYAIRSWIYMHHASLLLKSKNLKHLHYLAIPLDLICHKPDYIEIENLCTDGFTMVDKAADNLHPGIESNKLTAEKILDELNK
jgi:hypothetical protein